MNLSRHFHPESMTMTMMMTYSWALCELHKMRRKAKERRSACNSSCCKEVVCQQPYCPGCCGTLLFSSIRHNYPKDLPRAPPFSSRSGYHAPPIKRTLAKSSKHMSGGCEWRLMVWSTHIHVLEGTSWQRSNTRT